MLKKSILFLMLLVSLTTGEDCRPRDYGNGAAVCVCNSNYCDTIDSPEKLSQPSYYKCTSNKAGLRFNKIVANFNKSVEDHNNNKITINSKKTYQNITGFGGAFTDATGINIKSLPVKAQENLLNSYFSNNGTEYNLGRVPIGGTDFSTRGYPYHDGDADETLRNWKLASEDLDYKIPFIKKALNLTNGNLHLFASAWTAPKWMKTNNQYAGSEYFVKFFDAYKEHGIDFWGVTTGNEAFSLVLNIFNRINTVGWTPILIGNWIINNFTPTIRNSSHHNIKIMIHDDQRILLPWAVDVALRKNEANHYIDGIAVHWYRDKVATAALLTTTHYKYPDKFILATEACKGDKLFDQSVVLGSWERGEDYASSIIEDLTHWTTGWTDWNMALDLKGGPTYIDNYVDSPIIVNASAGEFYKQPMFYSLGHFSKFISRNSIVIDTSSFDSAIPLVAFKRPDNGTVVVILN